MVKVSFTASQDWPVPAGVSTLEWAKAWGAGGGGGRSNGTSGGPGGGGGFAYGEGLSVTPGETLRMEVGGGGDRAPGSMGGGGGGGIVGIKRLASPVQWLLVAGSGGGGGGGDNTTSDPDGAPGGAGGGSTGSAGSDNAVSTGGGGGSQVAGGAAGSGGGTPTAGSAENGGHGGSPLPAAVGSGGDGGDLGGGDGGDRRSDSFRGGGGGGGAGYYGGGGGGGAALSGDAGAGGGGGSGHATGSNTVLTAGSGQAVANNGDVDYQVGTGTGGFADLDGQSGLIVISYTPSGSSAAIAAGRPARTAAAAGAVGNITAAVAAVRPARRAAMTAELVQETASRGLTSGMATAAAAKVIRPFLLVKLAFDSGDLNLWTGYGDLSWGGDTYTGAGDLLGMEAIEETAEVRSTGVALQLSGVPSSLISLALNEDYQGRPATLWLGAFDASGAIISDPYQLFKGAMDVMEPVDEGDTARFTLMVESRLIDLRKPRPRRYTAEDQKITFPDDKGFDQVTAIQNVEIVWGRG